MDLGPSEVVLILIVVALLFGAKRLPELARGAGQALRIFKAETRGLSDDARPRSDDQTAPPPGPQAGNSHPSA